MKNAKQLISLFLLIAMFFTTFTGCGGEATSNESSVASTAATEDKISAEDAEVDAANELLTISWLGVDPPLEDGTWGEQTFEELFNVDVQIVRADTSEQQATLFASGAIPDVILKGNISGLGSLQSQGILAEISTEEIQKYMPEHYEMGIDYDPNFFTYSNIDGKNYGIPLINAVGSEAQASLIRSDWLEAVGETEIPTSIEDLERVFTKFRENDPDGNGKKDTYALTGATDAYSGQRFFASIFGAFGIQPLLWGEDENGNLQLGFISKECKEALKLLNKWYNMELIDPEFVTDQYRSSSSDVPSKFANGTVGFLEAMSFDDYQWDNDGHVNAKWVAANPSWQEFFETNKDNSEIMYSTLNVTTFSDDMVDPYYIVIPEIKGPSGKSGYYAGNNIRSYIVFGKQMENEPAKRARVMKLLEREATEEEVYVNFFGPEGVQWIWNEDNTQRIYNPNYNEHEDYHPQGQKNGMGWCLWPMYWGNENYLTLVGGDRQIQRYDLDRPTFQELPKIQDVVKTSLPTIADNPELTSTIPLDYMVKAIRGDVDIDATFDSTIKQWLDMGGQQLTIEANEWYQSTK